MSCCAKRPDTWMHPTGARCRQKSLAPQGASTASGHKLDGFERGLEVKLTLVCQDDRKGKARGILLGLAR